MRAAVMRDHRLVVEEIDAPEPRAGEVLAKTLACGICGSDLHALKHTERLIESTRSRERFVPRGVTCVRAILMAGGWSGSMNRRFEPSTACQERGPTGAFRA